MGFIYIDVPQDTAAAWRLDRSGASWSFAIHCAMPGKVATDAFGTLTEGRYERLFKDRQVKHM
jgi:hypothetical protein